MPDSEKKNTVENVSNFTPYGTNPKKDKMVKSDDWEARLEMAKEGYGLDVLVNDINWVVRETVAKQGYGLNVLINDENYDVLKATLNYLRKNNLTLAEWCNQNNKEIDLKKLAYSPYPEARIVAIKSGYVYKENEIYIAPECKFTPYGTNPEKDKMVNSYYPKDRLKMAKEGYGLDILINDKNWVVREAVTKRGYGLNILVKDENCLVRAAVADQDYDLNILVNDKDWVVREAVANQGYGLDILINDEDYDVRRAVVYQGYGLDVLINDKSGKVREAVKNYLTFHNLTIEQWKSNQDLSKTNIINQAKNAINDGKIDVKNVANNIKSTKNVLNDSINKTNKTNEIDRTNNINK